MILSGCNKLYIHFPSNPFISSSVDDQGTVTVPADGTYRTNDQLKFSLTYLGPVSVSGSPRITIDIGGTTVYADYVSGSGTPTLL